MHGAGIVIIRPILHEKQLKVREAKKLTEDHLTGTRHLKQIFRPQDPYPYHFTLSFFSDLGYLFSALPRISSPKTGIDLFSPWILGLNSGNLVIERGIK